MRLIARTALALVLSLAAGLSAFAQNDDEGTKDHPAVPRFPGFYIDAGRNADFDRHEFVIGEERNGDLKMVAREGRFLQNNYHLKDGARKPSIVEVIRNYENAFRRAGGQLLWSSPNDGRASYRMTQGGTERWMDLEVGSQGGWIRMTVIDVAAMAQKVELSASELLSALNRQGFVALTGILFDTGRETIKPESEPQLAEVRALLDEDKTLQLSIEGHTDNVGQPAANLALSKRRAEAVRAWLVAKGVAAARLAAQGFGDTKPVADNRSEDGRAKNRRVELVKR